VPEYLPTGSCLDLDVQADLLRVDQNLAATYGDDLALLRLLLGAVGNDDPTLDLLLLLDPADEQPGREADVPSWRTDLLVFV
jgi:hypothetical protein